MIKNLLKNYNAISCGMMKESSDSVHFKLLQT